MNRTLGSLRAAAVVLALLMFGASTAAAQAREAAQKTGNVITDSWITMKVHSQFIPEDALEGSDIDVDTNAGVVTLKGTVPNEAARTRAVAIAKATDGVKSVTDNLRIGRADAAEAGARAGEAAREATGTAGRAVTDGWIKSKIYSQYITEDALDDSDLDIDVTKGAVVLNGTVKSDAGKTRAEAIAKATEGVKSVKNNLKVTPKGF
jgi:hyperosmotically inducible protein